MFSMAMWMAALVAPVQIFVGDLHGLNTLEHQPQKVIAMEGHYESSPNGAPLILFGLPDDEAEVTRWKVEIPKLGSLILKHDPDAPMEGLDTVPDDEQPPVAVVFWAFRIMVGIGLAMLGIGLWSLLARWRKRLYDWTWLHRAALVMGPSGFVAVIAGWVTTSVVLRLMKGAPHPGEKGVAATEPGPIRSAGIVPGPGQAIGAIPLEDGQ